jgi:hydrogenase-4 component E
MAIPTQFSYDLAHLLGATVLLFSFALIYQRRIVGLFEAYAGQALFLALAAAWQGYSQDSPHLYVTGAIALVFKAIAVPVILNWIARKLGIHRTVETVIGIGLTMLIGVALVALSVLVVAPVTATAETLTRETLALALSVILIGLLIMIARRNAISQVIGFLSLENGVMLAAVGVKGMPLVVELSVAFSLLIAFIIFGLFFFRIRERFETLDTHYVESFRGERR